MSEETAEDMGLLRERSRKKEEKMSRGDWGLCTAPSNDWRQPVAVGNRVTKKSQSICPEHLDDEKGNGLLGRIKWEKDEHHTAAAAPCDTRKKNSRNAAVL